MEPFLSLLQYFYTVESKNVQLCRFLHVYFTIFKSCLLQIHPNPSLWGNWLKFAADISNLSQYVINELTNYLIVTWFDVFANKVDPDETAPVGAVSSGSTPGFALAVAIGANGVFHFQMALKNHNWRKYLAPRFLKIALHWNIALRWDLQFRLDTRVINSLRVSKSMD